jgi:hypothetical protein
MKAEDFGLIPIGNGERGRLLQDSSEWLPISLYNLGWGAENGYYRVPMLDFNRLFDLLIHTDDEDNLYGAASVLMDKYAEEVLNKVIEILNHEEDLSRYKKAFKALRLEQGMNHSVIVGKSVKEVEADHAKWRFVAERVKPIAGEDKFDKLLKDIIKKYKKK